MWNTNHLNSEIMNSQTIRKALICIAVIAATQLMSCHEIETPMDETDKEEVIDTLQNEEKEEVVPSPVFPQSIVILDKEVTIKPGYTANIEFRVNPSNADVDFKSFNLDLISTDTKLVSYITEPVNLKLKSIKYSRENKMNLRGQYTMTIEDKNLSTDYCERVAIVYKTKNEAGLTMEISSDVITVTPEYPSELPRVYITTPGGAKINSKTEWMEDSNTVIVDKDGNESLNASTSIRGRGNSTWTYPKKPYALKLDSKAEVLGMPKHKRWVLLANWMDRTLMRNDVAFEMGRRLMNWAPRGEFVELYLNGIHQGNYYLCEQIKPDKNRVDIDDDGYILEFDVYGPNDEINYFYTPVKNYPVTIKEPDEEVITSWDHPKFLSIADYTGNIEDLLEADKEEHARWSEVEALIDVKSYIDWWFIHEMTLNFEPNHPKSCYMHKHSEGKLYAGPVWDFDWGTYGVHTNDMAIPESLWYGYLLKYPEFQAAAKARWAEVKDTFLDIETYISETAAMIEASNEVTIYKWPLDTSTNGDEKLSFEKAVKSMKDSYMSRISAMDNYLSKF